MAALRLCLLPDRAGPARARRFAASAMAAGGFAGDVEAALLLVSEVVTNAVRHGAPPISLVVDTADHQLLVSVEDGLAEDLPDRQDRTPDQLGGWGLYLINALSDAWGCRVDDHVGKTVWFTLSGPA